METIDVREALAEQLEYAAEWRDRKADQYPEDERNEWSASSARELAAYVLQLDLSDQRVHELGEIHDGLDCWAGGEQAGNVMGRLGHDGYRCLDDMLDRIVETAREDHHRDIRDGILYGQTTGDIPPLEAVR